MTPNPGTGTAQRTQPPLGSRRRAFSPAELREEGGPRSEPDGRLSAHPALQRFSRAVRGWLPPAACTRDSRHRFGALHYAYLPASGHPQPPGPLRPAGGFPALPGGALLPRLLRGLCHRGTRVRQVIPRSSLSYVLARPRLPVHLLGCPRWASPRYWRCVRTQRHAGAVPGAPVSCVFPEGASFTPAGDWGSGNPALAISRGSPQRAARTHRRGRWFPGMLLSPSPFRSR